jgi:hypothetical protein
LVFRAVIPPNFTTLLLVADIALSHDLWGSAYARDGGSSRRLLPFAGSIADSIVLAAAYAVITSHRQ